MACLVKKVLVVQAYSRESESHFSDSDEFVSEKRNRLSADAVEALTVLKEAHLNKLWPTKKEVAECRTSKDNLLP